MAPTVVFLANDAVYEQALAFLESFRQFNPYLKLRMIPFAEDLDKLKGASSVYEYDILCEDYERWDRLGLELFPSKEKKYRNRLRKLSIFDLEDDVILYIDVDTVVTKDLSFLVEPILSRTVEFICTATGNDPWV